MKYLKIPKESLPRFEKPLFFEAMRQLKIGGLVYTAVCVVLSLIWMSDSVSFNDDGMQRTYNLGGRIESWFDGVILTLLFVSAVFLVAASFYLTTFLRSGKARDFYYATPHSAGTLWLNFAAAVFGWHAAAMGASFLVWLMMTLPFDLKAIGPCLLVLCAMLAVTFLYFAVIMLAVSLTGKIISAAVTLAGLMMTAPMLCTAFGMAGDFFRYFFFYEYSMRFPDVFTYVLSCYFDLPVPYPSGLSLYEMMTSGGTVAYSLSAGVLLTALAAYFASIRTGDAAGRPFVNKAAHLLSLMSVNVPFCCGFAIVTYMFCMETHFPYDDLDIVLSGGFAIAAVLAVFWLSELLMTFDVKKSHYAFRYMPLSLVIAFAAVLAGHWYYWKDVTAMPSVKEVESFTLVRNDDLPANLAVFRMYDSYGRTVTEEWEFTDEPMIRFLTDQLHTKAAKVKANPRGYEEWWEENEQEEEGTAYIHIQLNLKNGKSFIRTFQLMPEQMQALEALMLSDKGYTAQFLTLPAPEKVSIDTDTGGITSDEALQIYRSLVEEYQALSEEQKLAYLKSSLYRTYEDDIEGVMVYGDDEQSYVVENEDVAAEEPRTVTEPDWDNTCLVLQNASTEPGHYAVLDAYIYTSDSPRSSLKIELEGYREGRLYRPGNYFDFSLNVPITLMPRTNALIIKICNGKIDQVTDMVAKAEKRNTDMMLDAAYWNGSDRLNVNYTYLIASDDGIYSWEEPMIEPGTTVLRFDVNADEMIQKLYDDCKSTDMIDFTKPYCQLTVYPGIHRYKESMTFWIQTDMPFDVKAAKAKAESSEEDKTA